MFLTGLAGLTLFNANKTCLQHTKPTPKMVAPAATRRVFGKACDASDPDHSCPRNLRSPTWIGWPSGQKEGGDTAQTMARTSYGQDMASPRRSVKWRA